jgi:hypothetical protein
MFMTKASIIEAKLPSNISSLGIFLTSENTVPEKGTYSAPTLKKNILSYLEIGGN